MTAPPRSRRTVAVAARDHAPLLASVAVTLAWTVLALRSPTVTYHFAPGLAAAAWPVTTRVLRGRASPGSALGATLGGFAVAAFSTGELHVLDALQGPALVGGNATIESLLVAGTAAAWGSWTLSRPGTGWVVRAFGGRV